MAPGLANTHTLRSEVPALPVLRTWPSKPEKLRLTGGGGECRPLRTQRSDVAGQPIHSANWASMAALGRAPTMRFFSTPSWNTTMVGMLITS